jgi:hypothetical protein
MEELSRLFSQGGLRFDAEFLNRVFFNADNVVFRVYYGGPGARGYAYRTGAEATDGQVQTAAAPQRAGITERILMRMLGFFVKKMLGIQVQNPGENLDLFQDFELEADEARVGGEKALALKNGRKSRKLMVRIPLGVQSGTQIRLKGLGKKQGNQRGDLYLKVKVRSSGGL